MNQDRQPTRTFRSAQEAAGTLGLALLGSLPADPRLHPREAGLADLTPDPRFCARVYRFVAGPSPAVWVLGLGQAGEELPVAIAIAERAAASGAAPVLLVRPRESLSGPPGLPVAGGAFVPLLNAVLRGTVMAEPTGLQGVLRAWSGAGSPGDGPAGSSAAAPGGAGARAVESSPLTGEAAPGAVVPGGVVVAGDDSGDTPEPPPEALTHLVLVVPFRDVPAVQIEERVKALVRSGHPVVGMVAYGKEEEGAANATQPDEEPAASEAFVASQTRAGDGPARNPVASARDSVPVAEERWGAVYATARAAPAGASVAAATAAQAVPAGRSSVESARSATEPARSGAETAGSRSRDRIAVSGSWSATFGPGAASGSAAGGRHGLPLFWWLAIAILLLISAGVIFPKLVMQHIDDRPSGAKPVARMSEAPPSPAGQSDAGPPPALSGPAAGEAQAASTELAAGGEPAGGGESGASGVPAASGVPGASQPTDPGLGAEVEAERNPQEGGTPGDDPRQTRLGDPAGGPELGASSASAAPSGEEGAQVSTAEQDAARTSPPGGAAGSPGGAAPAESRPPADAGEELPSARALLTERSGPFAVLCGSVPRADLAAREVRRLAGHGIEARVVVVDIPERGVWCRVVTGRYDDVDSALAAARAIVAEGRVRAAQVVASEGLGPPVSRPVTRETP